MDSLYQLSLLRDRIAQLRAAGEPLTSERAKSAFEEAARLIGCPPDHPNPMLYFLQDLKDLGPQLGNVRGLDLDNLEIITIDVTGLDPHNLTIPDYGDPRHPWLYTLTLMRLDLLERKLRREPERTQERTISAIKPLSVPPRARGRPAKFDADTIARALGCKRESGSNREVAQILYGTQWPTAQQVKNVPSILKHHKKPRKRKKSQG